ncbi:MAG: hypothetical protein GX941_03140 [Candidatus Methanofastidiosa archaeon]|jgi:hypothetical protein|nr:hypothetical protein [Candidatus Methanofastidiosa archaeon]
MLAANLGTGILYLILNPLMKLIYPNVNPSIFYIYCLIAFLNSVFVVYLFKWKRWAFYAFCISSALTLLMNYSIGLGSFSVLGLLGLVILYLAMRPQWALFDI